MNIQNTPRFDFDQMGRQFDEVWRATVNTYLAERADLHFTASEACQLLEDQFDEIVEQLKSRAFPHRVATLWTESFGGRLAGRLDVQGRITEFLQALDCQEHTAGARARLFALTHRMHDKLLVATSDMCKCEDSQVQAAFVAAMSGQDVTQVLEQGISDMKLSNVTYRENKVELTFEARLSGPSSAPETLSAVLAQAGHDASEH